MKLSNIYEHEYSNFIFYYDYNSHIFTKIKIKENERMENGPK